MAKKIYTCIDIGNDTIRILVSEYYQKKYRTLAASSVRTKGVKNGRIVDEDLLIERIKLALEDINSRVDIKIKKAVITIPCICAEYNLVHGNIPIVNDEKMVTTKDILRVQNALVKDLLPNMELVNLTPIDFSIYENGSLIESLKDPRGKICDRLGIRAMMVCAPKSLVVSYAKVIEKAGVEVVDLCLSAVSSFEEIKTPEYKEDVMALIDVGKENTTISIFNKGIITNSKVLNIGSKIIDEDISYIYSTTKKTARKIKENFGIAHPRYSNKNETYETRDVNEKLLSINQYELSGIINKRLVEILNISKNELKVLTNKQISYIMVIGGIVDMPSIDFVLEDIFGYIAKSYSENTLGIRKSRFITVQGAIKLFVKKLNKRGKEYSMFSSDDEEGLIHSKTRIGRSDSVFGRFFSYFLDN
ncbi:MAG: rod shape-determining protein [Bacilli bacterium]|nr:rod shape-determining protein [Bacilli bacterium]